MPDMKADVICASSGLDSRRRRGYEQSTLITHRIFLKQGIRSLLLKRTQNTQEEASRSLRCFPFARLSHWLGNQVGETFMFEYILFACRLAFLQDIRAVKFIYTQEPWVARTLTRLKQIGLLSASIEIHFVCGVTMNEDFIPRFGDIQWVVNPEVHRLAKKKFPNSRIHYLPNPIEETKKFRQTEGTSTSPFPKTREKWILVVGAINRDIKRTHLVTEAWSKSYSENFGLCLLGEIQDESIVDQIAHHEAFLHKYTPPEEVSRFIHYADFICLASLNEGFPNILLECLINDKIPFLTLNPANTILLSRMPGHLLDFTQRNWIDHLKHGDNEAEIAQGLKAEFSEEFNKLVGYFKSRLQSTSSSAEL